MEEVHEDVVHLARWLSRCAMKMQDVWMEAFSLPDDKFKDFIWENTPLIQGMRNQGRIRDIGEQSFDTTKVGEAVDWMLRNND